MADPHITINLPLLYMEYFSHLLKKGIIPSRGEGIRRAIKYFLKKNKKCFEEIQK